MGLTYKESGVDIDKGDRFVKIIKDKLKGEEKNSIGLFGGLYDIGKLKYKNPVLVSSTDGVGTKLILAKVAKKYSSIGIDLVAMCVNDVITLGAKPLFLLDYMATSELDLTKASQIIDGILEGCRQSECTLLGGETAEMPGVYKKNDYELAGFVVGIIEKDRIINGESIKIGDKIIGIPSSGIHSNGISLARKALFEIKKYSPNDLVPLLEKSLIDELLVPTKIYVKDILELLDKVKIKGIAHITGGGLYGNIKRVVPNGMDLEIYWNKLPVLPIFKVIQEAGSIDDEEMRKTFNLGIGMAVIVEEKEVNELVGLLSASGEDAIEIGEIIKNKD